MMCYYLNFQFQGQRFKHDSISMYETVSVIAQHIFNSTFAEGDSSVFLKEYNIL